MFNKKNAGIIGVGKAISGNVLTNFDLEKIVDTNDEWIVNMTGIKERHICNEDTAASDLAVIAAKEALDRSNLSAEEIDVIIIATVTGDYILPSTASIVQHKIGAVKAAAFDLSAGCSGWVYALSVAYSYINSGFYKKALVIGVDLLSRITNWTDRSTCILFGDAAGAAVVSDMDNDGILDFDLGSDGSGCEFLKIEAGGSKKPITQENLVQHQNKIFMAGHEVFKFAVKIQSDTILRVLKKCSLNIEDVSLFVPHQANIRIIDSACKRLGVEKDKFFVNLQKYGNTSAASIPLALCEAWEEGKIKKGDIIAVCGFGAGLTWASGVMRWAY